MRKKTDLEETADALADVAYLAAVRAPRFVWRYKQPEWLEVAAYELEQVLYDLEAIEADLKWIKEERERNAENHTGDA